MTNAEIVRFQKALLGAGYSVGRAGADGLYGGDSLAGCICYIARAQLGAIAVLLARALIADFRRYEITSPLRMAHFLAQAAHETGGFKRFLELGSGDGPDADPWDDYLERYDFRKDLGNSTGGDGERYRGRGIFQLTGRANYIALGGRIGLNLVDAPARAAEPEIAALVACIYWTDRKMNLLADNDNELEITRKINGGTNGLDDRRLMLARAKAPWRLP